MWGISELGPERGQEDMGTVVLRGGDSAKGWVILVYVSAPLVSLPRL